MLSFFFRPHLNRGFGPIWGDPDDMPSWGSSFIRSRFILLCAPTRRVSSPEATIVVEDDRVHQLGQATLGEPYAGADRSGSTTGSGWLRTQGDCGDNNWRGLSDPRRVFSIRRKLCLS
jgi:hypothetical protein